MIKVGPVGKMDPNNAAIVGWDDGGRNDISQIILSGGDNGITSIQFQYIDVDGKSVLSNVYGQPTHLGNIFETIELKYPDEYLTGISGEYTTEPFTASGYYSQKHPRIRALKFTTNEGEYGPFGRTTSSSGGRFTFRLGTSPQFGGFHGTYDGNGLHSIGVYLRPKTVVVQSNKVDPTIAEGKEKASVIALA